jgi:putative ABC transport system permease protein
VRAAFVVRLALREGQSALRRIGVFAASIALGVGALVTIHGLREDMTASVEAETEALLGADVRLSDNGPFPDAVLGLVDSLAAAGHSTSSVTTVLSMVMAPRTGEVRLLQVRGVEGAYPFYGRITSTPADAWPGVTEGNTAVVEPGVLTQLGVAAGDSLVIGEATFVVAGTVEGLPVELGLRAAAGPRVHISAEGLQTAGLLTFGSLARYEVYLEMPDRIERREARERFNDVQAELGQSVRFTTADAEARELTEAVDWLGRYLGLVGLAGLLLGAVGVASAVHVFVREKLSTVAVLRCLGARQSEVFSAYLALTAALALLGSAAGAALGMLVQAWLPGLLSGLLPLEVTTRPRPLIAGVGVLVGLWVSVLFALAPLLAVRDVPPLLALRRDFEAPRRRLDPARGLVIAGLLATVLLLSMWEAPERDQGVGFAVGIAGVALLLWLTGRALMWIVRKLFPSGAPYPLRQGVANLFRPRNQTIAVTLALGFGAFVVGTLLQVQGTIVQALSLETGGQRPNLVLFDVQPDQTQGVLALLPPALSAETQVTPMVPARIARIPGEGRRRADRWALRREYRHTFRAQLTPTETLVEGRWFDSLPPRQEGSPARVSMEVDLAEALGVGVGDTVVWNFSGSEVTSVITSLRLVDWGQFTTNFFVVFEPGVLEEAPRMDVVLARVLDEQARGEVQRQLVMRYPNVSSLDVDQVQETLASILGKVSTGVRFLALASALAGGLVLLGALSTSRHQRTREAALLRTLGARRRQVTGVLLAEYTALGTVAALAGLLLAGAAAAWIVEATLGLGFTLQPASLIGVWLGVSALSVGMGFLMSLPVLRRPPLPVLREVAE